MYFRDFTVKTGLPEDGVSEQSNGLDS